MSLYADLIRIVLWLNVPDDVKNSLMELMKEIEDKLNELDTRVKALE